jgi:hypothetical protein
LRGAWKKANRDDVKFCFAYFLSSFRNRPGNNHDLTVKFGKIRVWTQKGHKKSFLQIACAGNPSRDPVDACVKKIKTDECAGNSIVYHNLFCDFNGFIIEQHHMIAVPTYRARHVKRKTLVEKENGRYFVRNHLRRMVMPAVEQG